MKKDKLLVLIMLGIIFIIGINNRSYALDSKILENIYVKEIDLSNLTKDEAIKKINFYIEKNRNLELNCYDKKIIVDKSEFDLDYKVGKLVDEAYNIGRDKDIISNFKTKISLKKGNKMTIPLICDYNTVKIEKLIDNISMKFYIAPVDANAEIVDENIIVTQERFGQAVDKDKLKRIIISKIENIDSRQTQIPLKVIAPKYTYQQLIKIDTLLGSYETYFNPQNKSRVDNIEVAAKSTSNVLINTNEKFSFNKQLRDKNGYAQLKTAPIILNGKHDQGIGGGICQVSTTIYNAALYAGMKIIDINNHSIPSPYIKKGRDATVSNGYMDFVFKNDNKTPIIVYNQIFENKIVSKIYGNNDDKRDIEIKTEIVNIIKNKKIYKNDPKLDKRTKVVEQEGRLGYTVNTFRLYKSNNEIVKRELINTSYYPPCDEIVLKGTKDNTVYK